MKKKNKNSLPILTGKVSKTIFLVIFRLKKKKRKITHVSFAAALVILATICS